MQRLSQLITRNLGCSRRQAEALIDDGLILDGEGRPFGDRKTKIAGDNLPLSVLLHGEPMQLLDSITVMQHKPVGCVTALIDNRHPTAFALLKDAPLLDELRPLGRLDLDTSGLLLWTTDGQWLHRMTHPRFGVPRTYQASLARPFDTPPETLTLRDGHEASIVSTRVITNPHSALAIPAEAALCAEITLTGGAYHEVRRIFAALGSHVFSLCRVRYGEFELPTDLPAGLWVPVERTPASPSKLP